MIRRRNPAWLAGTDPPYAVQLRLSPGLAPKRGRRWEERREQRLQDVIGVNRFLSGDFDIETEKAARERRKAGIRAEGRIEEDAAREIERERQAPEPLPAPEPVKPARTPRAKRPVNIVTRIRRLGGISLGESWRTWPGQKSVEFVRSLPGVFRKRGGMSWENMAMALTEDGYGPTYDYNAENYDASWLVDALDNAAAGSPALSFEGYFAQAEREQAKAMREHKQWERWQRQQQREERKSAPRRRRTNPRLLIVGNPTRTAHAAFRKFHGTEPSKVRRIDGDDDLVALGDIVEVIYRPRTGVRTDADYVHKFKPGAILAATVDGTALHVIPNPRKPFRVDWSRGIIG